MGPGRRSNYKQDEWGGFQAQKKYLKKKKRLSRHEKQERESERLNWNKTCKSPHKSLWHFNVKPKILFLEPLGWLQSPLHICMTKYELQCNILGFFICLPQDSVN